MAKERKKFGSSVQFILSCIGYAVGLGNIWRFPKLAFDNGGSSFIFVYLCCSFLIGFPMLYLELSLGQFSQSGPATAYGKIRPYAQGIGWGMAIMSLLVSVYYNVIVSWTLVFVISIFMGQSTDWALCENEWNDQNCLSSLENEKCIASLNDGEAFYFNGSCYNSSDFDVSLQAMMQNNRSATSQFFENYILQKTATIEDFGGINWPVFGALIFVWIITALALSKGVKLIGKLSYVTATVPYIIIAILFVRSVTLPGAEKGLDYYLFTINTKKIFDPTTWKNAATQVCYSLAIGFGGLLSLASYNNRSHNCFRDAIIITAADGFMSIFGGTAVFSVLGFMATEQKKEISEVLKDGTGLAFIAYPEAMNQLPVAWLWAFLFFLMLFLLGISSQFGLAEVMCTAIYDQFPSTQNRHFTVASCVCSVLFLLGIIMTTKAGIFYFQIFNDFSASFSLCINVLLELALICYIYGVRNYIKDLRTMFGEPRNLLGKIFGKSGWYFIIVWCIVAPICISVLLVFMVIEQVWNTPKYEDYKFPRWSLIPAWALSVFPLFAIPIVLIGNIIHFRAIKKPLKDLAVPREDWGALTHEPKTTSSASDCEEQSPTSPATTTSPNLYKIRSIEISPLTSDPWSSNTVTARTGKSGKD